MEKINFINNVTKANADTFNTMQDNIEDAIDIVDGKTLDTYSTTETRIGTWIDGKPLYRKVFTISSPQSSNTNYEDLNSLNTNKIVHLYGYYETANGKFDIPFYDSDSNYSVMFVSSGRLLRGRFGSASSITEAKVVLEYTKTTD